MYDTYEAGLSGLVQQKMNQESISFSVTMQDLAKNELLKKSDSDNKAFFQLRFSSYEG